MRQIRFRAKPCYMGGNQPAWVYGTFQYIAQRRVRPGATDNGTLEPRNDKGRIVDLYGTETEVLCDTVGQFTGLRDIDGREIYEGDIVDLRPRYSQAHRIEYSCGQWICVDADGGWATLIEDENISDEMNDVKVIGNIYDNPEFLKRH